MNINGSCSTEDSISKDTTRSISAIDTTEDQLILHQNCSEIITQHHIQQQIEDQHKIVEENSVQNTVQHDNVMDSQLALANDDEFIRIKAAHQILNEARTHDEQNNYALALQLYRICVDFLLEELMFAEGTEQSRIYLREKCTAMMDRIDLLKTKLDPLPASDENQQSSESPPANQFELLNLH